MFNPLFAVFQRYNKRRHNVVQRKAIDVENKKMTVEAIAANRHVRGHITYNNNIRPRSANSRQPLRDNECTGEIVLISNNFCAKSASF
jgi:hypothetical protein